MAALAYLFPPISGLIAYGLASTSRLRWHGLQSVLFGAAWPAAIYLGSAIGPLGTRIAFALGLLLWMGLLFVAAIGRDPRLPGSRLIRSLAGHGDEPAEEQSAPEATRDPSA